MIRVRAYIDGYNLYHQIKKLNKPHLKWVDLWALMNMFVAQQSSKLDAVFYFSAYAYWLPKQEKRHRAYVSALKQRNVNIIMSKFKQKTRKCPQKHIYTGHEEKESDVRLALAILDDAHRDRYDTAMIVSRDSDIIPAVEIASKEFPEKTFISVAPPNAGHSNEMLKFCKNNKRNIKEKHLVRCLLPDTIKTDDGYCINRPSQYSPPFEHL